MAVNKYPLIILAGGASSRMGSPKGLLAYGDQTWLETQVAAFLRAEGREVIVVLGHRVADYERKFPWLAAGYQGVQSIVNHRPDLGQMSSILTGARRATATGAFVLPVDVPCPGPVVFEALAQAMVGDVQACLPMHKNEGGHPVLLSGSFLRQLLLLEPTDPNFRLDQQLKTLSDEHIRRVNVTDERIRMSFNTPQEWTDIKRLLNRNKTLK